MVLNQIIAQKDGKDFKAYVAKPAGGGQGPGLILMHEVYGVTESVKKLADRFAEKGFYVACPNLYWESAPDAHFTHETPEDEQRKKDGTIDPQRLALLDADRDAARDLMFNFVNRAQQGFADLSEKTAILMSYIETLAGWLRAQPECNGSVAATGYCFGARNTYLALAKQTSVEAGVAFYPTPRLAEVLDSAEAAAIDKPFLFVVGGEDPYINEKQAMLDMAGQTVAYLAGLEQPLRHMNPAGNGNIATLYYANSTHGFNRSDSKYTDTGTSQHALGIAASFLHAALGTKKFNLPPEALHTVPQSPTYQPQHKV